MVKHGLRSLGSGFRAFGQCHISEGLRDEASQRGIVLDAFRRASRYAVPVCGSGATADPPRHGLDRVPEPNRHLDASTHERERIVNHGPACSHDVAELALLDHRAKSGWQHILDLLKRRTTMSCCSRRDDSDMPSGSDRLSTAACISATSRNSIRWPLTVNGAVVWPVSANT
jgi:hypothetical protein